MTTESTVLHCEHCEHGTMRYTRMVRFGYVMTCDTCGRQRTDNDYSQLSVCDNCNAMFQGVDGPDEPINCPDCRKEPTT